jgi:hypothetical protein
MCYNGLKDLDYAQADAKVRLSCCTIKSPEQQLQDVLLSHFIRAYNSLGDLR